MHIVRRSSWILTTLASAILGGAPLAVAQSTDFESPLGLLSPTATEHWLIRMDSYIRPIDRVYSSATWDGIWTQLSELSVVYPVPQRASIGALHDDTISAQLYKDDYIVNGDPYVIDGYYLGARMLRWDWTTNVKPFQLMRMHFEARFTTWALEFDEQRARQVEWPSEWPIVARSALEPQLFIEPDDTEVQALVREWVGASPRRLAPAVLAKTLAAHVINEFQPSTAGYEYNNLGYYAGLRVEGAAFAARAMRGTPFDQAALLCALYRAAGLPARVVLAFDIGASIDGLDLEDRSDREECQIVEDEAVPPNPVIRPWVEFYLYDEKSGAGEWIPVDVERQRQVSSRAYPLDQKWSFFGNMPCGDILIPLAFHFHPPEVVVSPGPPAMWGWIGFPETPRVQQDYNISSTSFGLTADDMP